MPSQRLVAPSEPEPAQLPAVLEDEAKAVGAREQYCQELDEKLHRKRKLTTNKDVVDFLSDLILNTTHGNVERQMGNTLAYMSGMQLKAIAAMNAEQKPSDTLSSLLGQGASVEIKMTREERKMYLSAGSLDKQTQILQAVKDDGRIVELEPQTDGSFSLPPMEKPPAADSKMPVETIQEALYDEGMDISTGEVLEMFGVSLGSTPESDLDIQGFDALYRVTPSNTPGLAHQWKTELVDHPKLPGVTFMQNECTACGVMTKGKPDHYKEKLCQPK